MSLFGNRITVIDQGEVLWSRVDPNPTQLMSLQKGGRWRFGHRTMCLDGSRDNMMLSQAKNASYQPAQSRVFSLALERISPVTLWSGFLGPASGICLGSPRQRGHVPTDPESSSLVLAPIPFSWGVGGRE